MGARLHPSELEAALARRPASEPSYRTTAHDRPPVAAGAKSPVLCMEPMPDSPPVTEPLALAMSGRVAAAHASLLALMDAVSAACTHSLWSEAYSAMPN